MFNLLAKIIGTKNERELRRIRPVVDKINEKYEYYRKTLRDEELPKITEEFKERLRAGETLDDILVDAYALVKDACRRLLGKSWPVTGIEKEWDMVPYDVQLIGAVVLHEGKIAEMATGEGKTLVATMPLYLNALTGRGVHLVTVNDYLARRDREWMGPVYESLGLTVGVIQAGMSPDERRPQYECDITYGTNNEFGFDYLRDNMAIRPEHRVQRGHYYAIIDEVDSVLIDEARTPLIISGPVPVEESRVRIYKELKPRVERVVYEQTRLVNKLVSEAERLLRNGNRKEAGIKLLQAKRGAPKNKRLMKLMHEPGVQQLIEETEAKYMKEKKLHELDEVLYFSIDEKSNIVDITEKGRKAIAPDNPDFFTLPDLPIELKKIDEQSGLSPRERAVLRDKVQREYAEKSEKIHAVTQLLKAYSLFERDVEYIVQDGRVIIVDEFTGRLMPGRRYSDGLHEALEAKEGVRVERETQTLATITLQNYFRMYEKLAGMTGTAATEAQEFWEIYKLDVVVIPTHKPVRRVDYDDLIFRTKREKYKAIIEEVERLHKKGIPVLVGTVSVEVSETLSRMLQRRGIRHEVLNAKHHQREAEIVAHAGERGRVTIATNMAGRGTDIKLGPGVVKCDFCILKLDEELARARTEEERKKILEMAEKTRKKLKEAGLDPDGKDCLEDMPCGLHIIGSERHDARRIDLQLRGRSGRQGDPGSSRFYISLEDDLMRLFARERIARVMDRMGIKEGEPIKHPLITRAIENAQRRVERYHFDIRKRLLEFDDVMNRQREVIYGWRNEILDGKNMKDRVLELIDYAVEEIVDSYTQAKYPEDWDWEGLEADLIETFLIELELSDERKHEIRRDELEDMIKKHARERYEEKEKLLGEERMREFERLVMLQIIDENWRHHLYELDALKEGIYLRSYAQKDPLVEYKREAFGMFEELVHRIQMDTVKYLFRFQPEAIAGPREVRGRAVKEEFRERLPEGEAPPEEEKIIVMPKEVIPEIGDPVLDARFKKAVEKLKREGKIKKIRDIGRNEPCPCGSGKKFKKCHGRNL